MAGEQRTVLQNVRWETYEQLLVDLASQSSPRLTFNRGTLEIMSPLPEHELLIDLIEMIIKIFAVRSSVNVRCLRSTTFKRQDLEKGFEADSCFYIQHEALLRGKKIIDLSKDPPPDLVIEIDITSASMNKLAVYSQMRVPEVWRYDGRELTIYALSGENYNECTRSLAFPSITSKNIGDFIRENEELSSNEFMKVLEKWVDNLLNH